MKWSNEITVYNEDCMKGWLLFKYAKRGFKILDTHLGSGSHATACSRLGFELTAFEMSKQYFDDSYKRFKNETAQQRIDL